ncbi:hypothetical protein C8R47DRAFT_996836, partial [Mycena vitilis]
FGQNSSGATHSDTANWQKSLASECEDGTINAIPLAFLDVFFSTGNLPEIHFANVCFGARRSLHRLIYRSYGPAAPGRASSPAPIWPTASSWRRISM